MLTTPIRFRVLKVSITFALLLCVSCSSGRATKTVSPQRYSVEVVQTYPHDASAFTQGLIFRDGKLLESTGKEGRSSLRSVDLASGKVLKQVDVAPQYFAEGVTVLNDKIYQLTWHHHLGFIYDYQTLDPLGQFNYTGEGWGLTNDGTSLILSDGSNRLRFLDPSTFKVTKTIAVADQGRGVYRLNELEYLKGKIYANIWHDPHIATIDPETGNVTAWIDCTALMSRSGAQDSEAVLNGIAVDETNGRMFVTGKLWPKLFEIRVKK